MKSNNQQDKANTLEISESLRTSPLAVRAFLDALAELIAQAILEEAIQGSLQNAGKTSSQHATPEGPSC